jgi:hypothetical protein
MSLSQAATVAVPQSAAVVAVEPDVTLAATTLAALTAVVTAAPGIAAAPPVVAAGMATVATTAGVMALPMIGYTCWKVFGSRAVTPAPTIKLATTGTVMPAKTSNTRTGPAVVMMMEEPAFKSILLKENGLATGWTQRNIMDRLIKQKPGINQMALAKRSGEVSMEIIVNRDEDGNPITNYEMFDPIHIGVMLVPFLALLIINPFPSNAFEPEIAMTPEMLNTLDSISSVVASSEKDFGGYTLPIVALTTLAAIISLLAGPVDE